MLIERIASLICARSNCLERGNSEWKQRHEAELLALAREHLPSGAGIDAGTRIDLDRSKADKVVLTCGYHHMNDGYYEQWTNHTITIRPSFIGQIDIVISGRNRNGIKEYLHEVFHQCLTADYQGARTQAELHSAILLHETLDQLADQIKSGQLGPNSALGLACHAGWEWYRDHRSQLPGCPAKG